MACVAFKCANCVMAIIFKFLCGGKKLKHVGLSCREKVCVMVDVYSGILSLSLMFVVSVFTLAGNSFI